MTSTTNMVDGRMMDTEKIRNMHMPVLMQNSIQNVNAAKMNNRLTESLDTLYIQKMCILNRVNNLQSKIGGRRFFKFPEPNRTFTHWDYLLQEMKWMALDFSQERRSKISHGYLFSHKSKAEAEKREKILCEKKSKEVAVKLSFMVSEFYERVAKKHCEVIEGEEDEKNPSGYKQKEEPGTEDVFEAKTMKTDESSWDVEDYAKTIILKHGYVPAVERNVEKMQISETKAPGSPRKRKNSANNQNKETIFKIESNGEVIDEEMMKLDEFQFTYPVDKPKDSYEDSFRKEMERLEEDDLDIFRPLEEIRQDDIFQAPRFETKEDIHYYDLLVEFEDMANRHQGGVTKAPERLINNLIFDWHHLTPDGSRETKGAIAVRSRKTILDKGSADPQIEFVSHYEFEPDDLNSEKSYLKAAIKKRRLEKQLSVNTVEEVRMVENKHYGLHWTPSEDQFLDGLVKKFGAKWTVISDVFNIHPLTKGKIRQPYHCEERWFYLRLKEGKVMIYSYKINPQESDLIPPLVDVRPLNWRYIPGFRWKKKINKSGKEIVKKSILKFKADKDRVGQLFMDQLEQFRTSYAYNTADKYFGRSSTDSSKQGRTGAHSIALAAGRPEGSHSNYGRCMSPRRRKTSKIEGASSQQILKDFENRSKTVLDVINRFEARTESIKKVLHKTISFRVEFGLGERSFREDAEKYAKSLENEKDPAFMNPLAWADRVKAEKNLKRRNAPRKPGIESLKSHGPVGSGVPPHYRGHYGPPNGGMQGHPGMGYRGGHPGQGGAPGGPGGEMHANYQHPSNMRGRPEHYKGDPRH